ncbi:MAG TPA: hydrogenase expression/formation protein HypE [Kineosporiaceae bacterium]|nr:hydrogenase expression/formation protein HypE [Kineosporiaceae bacterium]
MADDQNRADGARTMPELDFDSWSCPVPLRSFPAIVMGHGGGGALSAELIDHLFVPALIGSAAGGRPLAGMGDSAVLELGGARLAFSTDSYVVRPMFFPGGSIGDLAVNGTVNDLAMSGAQAAYLSCGFILEEGTGLDVVGRVAQAMGRAAEQAGVTIATGDTKVVDSGHGDGIYINTAGIGLVPAGVDIRPQRARPGDVVIVSGDIGVHGVAILSVREGLEFGTEVRSDSAPLNGLVAAMLAARGGGPGIPSATTDRAITAPAATGSTGGLPPADIHVLRDPTRGGLAATLNEIAKAGGVGVEIVERSVPVPEAVRNACGFLGLDPWYVANEGKLVAFVAREDADAVLAAMRAHPYGTQAAIIGECVEDHAGMVVAKTGLGGTRVVDLPLGEQLPRIC